MTIGTNDDGSGLLSPDYGVTGWASGSGSQVKISNLEDSDGFNQSMLSGYSGSHISILRADNILKGSATWNPADLVDGTGETSASITVTGATLGDYVICSAPYDLEGVTCNAYVDATDSVKIRLQNETGGNVNLASGTWKVKVIKA
jgi:hypothetical protein